MKGISEINLTENVALVTFNNFPNNIKIIAQLFEKVSDSGVNIDMISQTPPIGEFITLSFSCNSNDIVAVLGVVNEFKKDYTAIKSKISDGHCKLQFFGKEMRYTPGVAANVLKLVAESNADVMLITTSELDVSMVVNSHKAMDIIDKAKNF